MVRKVVGIVLIIAAAGAYLYLDQMNKEELQAAADARKAMLAASAKAKAQAAEMMKEAQAKTAAVAKPAKK
jgi:uncharacterized protein (UPF0333 family)